MQALGRQILVEYYGCNSELINSEDFVAKAMVDGTRMAKATIVSYDFHKFSPHGISGVVVIAESHVAIHTWPEYQYAAVDIFTCGDTIDPWIIFRYLENAFQSNHTSKMEIKRGQFDVPKGVELRHKPLEEEVEGK